MGTGVGDDAEFLGGVEEGVGGGGGGNGKDYGGHSLGRVGTGVGLLKILGFCLVNGKIRSFEGFSVLRSMKVLSGSSLGLLDKRCDGSF